MNSASKACREICPAKTRKARLACRIANQCEAARDAEWRIEVERMARQAGKVAK